MKNLRRFKLLTLALVLLTGLVGCAEWRSNKTVGQNIDDTNIVAIVKAKLTADSEVSAKNVTVNSYKGTVQLSGFVNDSVGKARAVEIANSVKGVRKVINNLVVSTSPATL